MSQSPITHAAAIDALSSLLDACKYEATHGRWPSSPTLLAMVRADEVITATHAATPEQVYCHLKQAKAAAKLNLKRTK
jgi:hypothetical protein